MSERTSFSYEPARSGYDSNSWRTISGSPSVSGAGRIAFDTQTGIGSSAIHYADFLKGDITFDVNVPSAPADGDSRTFGVSSPNTSAYVRFSIGSTLVAQCSDGSTSTSSSAITWDSAWTGANVKFRIQWESGRADFFISGTKVASISDASVPYGPLSLYVTENSATSMTIGTIAVKGTQSYVMNIKSADSTSTASVTTGTLSRSESVTITENVSLSIV